MRSAQTVLLDNEAVQALADLGHAKHRRVLAVVEATASRNVRRAGSVTLVVPAAVQVEAGWDRMTQGAATLNRIRAAGASLDRPAADQAASLVAALRVSVADAHIGAVLSASTGPHAVLTSDPGDIRRMADHLGIVVNVVTV